MKKIILCSTQRSGSTMVVEDMRNSDVLGNPEEYFIQWQDFDSSVNINQEVDELFRKGTKQDTFSIKVMASQVKKVNFLLKNSSNYSDIFNLFSDSYWVYIKRNDILKQAISRYMASKTKINHAVENNEVNHFVGNLIKEHHEDYNNNVPYSFDIIYREICNIYNENIFWEEFFKRNNIKPLILQYETYVKYAEHEHIFQIMDHVKISNKPTITNRKLKKLSNNRNTFFEECFKNDMFNRYYI